MSDEKNTAEEKFPLLIEVKWQDLKLDSNGLVTCVVQDDENEQVLMVAYMNQEAYEQTVSTGRMTYWSRSRQELWVKGMTSGHFQYLKKMLIDCDNDTLLARVEQVGAACHTGHRSCFFREVKCQTGTADKQTGETV